MSTIDFIAVPQPAGRVSVLVVPRLTGATISDMADWPLLLAGAELEIVADHGGMARVGAVDAPGPDLWRAAFAPTTPVDATVAPADEPEVTIDETADAAQRVAATYETSARALVDADDDTVRRELAAWEAPQPIVTPVDVGTGEWVRPGFHRTISLLREHPRVLRALGLIFDVDPPAGFLGDSGRLRVRWPANALVVSPWTAYERTDRGWFPAASGDISGGMIDLGGPDWTLAAMDVTGGVARLRDAARALAADPEQRAVLPPLRSQGLALLRRGRGAALDRRRRERARRAALAERTLTAEDLVLGYRVDVRRQGGGGWQTLTGRMARYAVNGIELDPEPRHEEAHVKAAAFARDDAKELRGDEIVTRWDGWSLVIPRPTTGRPEQRRQRADLLVELDADFAFEPGSLPSLRFGEQYRLRVRIADVTGGGIGLDAIEADSSATAFTAYRRFEPVDPPTLEAAHPTENLRGDGGEEIVIRSDRGLDVAAFSAAHPEYPAVVERRIGAPRVALRIADEHGALDAASDDVIHAAALSSSITDPLAGGVALTVRDEPGTLSPGASIDEDWTGAWPTFDDKVLRVGAPEAGRPRLEWRASVAMVRPSAGERLTVEITSYPTEAKPLAFAHLLDDVPESGVTTGHHPMVSPPRPVRIVHAVRAPVADPAGTLDARRNEGDTAVDLVATPPLLGLHVGSTAQVDVSASWQEWMDAAEPTAARALLTPAAVPPGADRLPPIRHEFADTKHRRVTYRVSAISRFRGYFSDADPDDAFRAAATLVEVRVPSSARPPQPLVLSVSPAFRWSGTELPEGWTRVVRTRHGGMLRVELARPWYVSGEDERLAVLVWDSPEAAPPSGVLTRIGRDPIRDSGALQTYPPLSAFEGAVDPVFRDGGIAAVPYATWFADDRWWADIRLPGVADVSYSPFVQLALTRYQADSVPGQHLSQPTLTEPATVLPDRVLTLERDGSGVTVTLTGDGAGTPSHVVHVDIQVTEGSADTEAVVSGTPPLGAALAPDDETVAVAAVDAMTRGAWRTYSSATTGLGAPVRMEIRSITGRYRVVVRETEDIPGDPPTADVPAELVSRTVFLDIVPL